MGEQQMKASFEQALNEIDFPKIEKVMQILDWKVKLKKIY